MTLVETYKTKFVTMTFMMISALFATAGCNEPPASISTPVNSLEIAEVTATSDDLSVTLRLPRKQYTLGDELPVMMFAANRGSDGIRLSSSTSAPYQLFLEQATPLGWEIFKTYPEASAMVLSEWTLMPGENRTIQTKLLVERDWPTLENLRLRACLPSRPDVAPAVHIEVTPE
jgi:hypothetical protein